MFCVGKGVGEMVGVGVGERDAIGDGEGEGDGVGEADGVICVPTKKLTLLFDGPPPFAGRVPGAALLAPCSSKARIVTVCKPEVRPAVSMLNKPETVTGSV